MNNKNDEDVFNEYQNMLKGCANRNLPLILALQLEVEDVIQELSIRLFKAIDRFDEKRSKSLTSFLYCELQFEILDIRRRHKPLGIVGVPKDERLDVIYLDKPQENEISYELLTRRGFDIVYVEEALGELSLEERAVTARKLRGDKIAKNVDKRNLESAKRKLEDYYRDWSFEYA